jgi:formylglycine-generating enzyme required for sulfatase activity
MGSTEPDAYEEDKPQRTVYLTPYFIDIYEVTNARYIECINAGACTPPPSYTRYDEPDMQDHPVIQVTYYQAMDFCQWDGGRTLPTEAQWEKAAKGPAPEDPRHPWGDQEPSCSLAFGRDCHDDRCMTASVDNCPSGVSFYGVYGMASNASEWCWDYYDPDYYSTGPDFDPTGPSSGLERSRRGWEACRYFYYWQSSTASRLSQEPTEISTSFMTGFRCARRGY